MKEQINELPHNAAGRLMTKKVPVIRPGATIAQVEALLLKSAKKLETINYIYVTSNRKLIGVLSIKEVFRLPKETQVASVIKKMKKELVTVRPHTEAERTALLAIEHNLKEIPVVDKDGLFLGVVGNDTILRILHEENIEDILRFAGIHDLPKPALDIMKAPASIQLEKRLPWLVFGLLGGLIAASVVSQFESALKLQLILASFIPAIAYMADAVGTQTQTLFIRSLSLDYKLNLFKYIIRESKVAIGISIFLSALIAFLSYLFWQIAAISIILGLSFLATILVAMAVALFLPWFFTKIKIDPAVASGPFATIIRDILSLAIYFWIAQTVLSYLA